MFALWYGTLIYKEYRDAIWNKLTKKQPSRETAIISPSRIPIAEPKMARTPSPQPPKSPQAPSSPMPPPRALSSPISHSTPNSHPEPPKSVESPKPLEPPAKPPRSPSPHPMRSEAFEEIVYNDEVDEGGSTDEDEEEEEEDENSVISSPRITNAINEQRDAIWNKLTKKQPSRETAIISPSRISIAEPIMARTPTPQPPKSPEAPSSPMPPPIAHSTPISTPEPPKPLEPPAEPPRSPSPHPMRSEVFEEIGYDVEVDEGGSTDEDQEEEEEDENSVISSPRITNSIDRVDF